MLLLLTELSSVYQTLPPAPPPHTHSLVAVHDGVQPVGDGDRRAVGELLSDGYLDELICL